jgi:hypothetical protein
MQDTKSRGERVCFIINVKGKIAQPQLDKVNKVILSWLDRVDKWKCHCRTKWQYKVEWIRLVDNLH